MHQTGSYVLLSAGGEGDLALQFARVAGARMLGHARRQWIAPTTLEAAQGVRAILALEADISVSREVLDWLDASPIWTVAVDIKVVDRSPWLEIRVTSGHLPDGLSQLAGARYERTHVMAPLSVGNLRSVAELPDQHGQLELSWFVRRARSWLAAHPQAAVIPAAELDIVADGETRKLILDPIWDPVTRDAFDMQELRLWRERRSRFASALDMPAEVWPDNVISALSRYLNVAYTPAAAAFVESALQNDPDIPRLRALSRATTGGLTVRGLRRELRPFQRAAVEYVLERRRVLLADDEGLGGSVQALAALEADGASPALIVCEARRQSKWLRTAGDWLPHRHEVAFDGTETIELWNADIVVVNYEALATGVDLLGLLDLRAIVLEEPQHERSPVVDEAVQRLLRLVRPDAIRLVLAAGYLVGRASELASHLRCLGRLSEFGGAQGLAETSSDPDGLRRLRQELRASCYVRRRRRDLHDKLYCIDPEPSGGKW